MNKQKPRVELKAEGRTLGYGRASNMFGCESARMPCSIALFVVVCVLFSQQCPFSSRRLRELKAAAPRSRRQESKRSSPLCWARISKPPTSAGRAQSFAEEPWWPPSQGKDRRTKGHRAVHWLLLSGAVVPQLQDMHRQRVPAGLGYPRVQVLQLPGPNFPS